MTYRSVVEVLADRMDEDTTSGLFSPDKRQARVAVVNNTSEPIVAVSVVHKYSGTHKNRHEWPVIAAGKSSEGTMTVDYNTGAFTTGRNWWFVAWYNKDLTRRWYSNPTNFHDVIDKLETVDPQDIKAAGSGREAADNLARLTTEKLFNSESTAGFKQHILRVEDANRLTEIIINSDRTITFKSKSGRSDTVAAESTVE